jgi:Fe2+ transport system protein B
MASSVIDNTAMDAVGIVIAILGVVTLSVPVIVLLYVLIKVFDNR